MAALAAVGAMTVLVTHGPRDAPVVPGPAPVFTAAALDDRMVLIRLRAVEAKHISQVHRAGGGRGSPASHGHGHPRALSPPSGPGRHLTFAQWLARPETRKIQKCESDGNYRLVDYNKIPGRGWVAFFGAWQMDDDFVGTYAHVNPWHYVHHGEFTMPPAMQDRAAYAGYVDRGDEPWQCR